MCYCLFLIGNYFWEFCLRHVLDSTQTPISTTHGKAIHVTVEDHWGLQAIQRWEIFYYQVLQVNASLFSSTMQVGVISASVGQSASLCRYDVHMWPARGREQAGFNARQHCLPTSQRPRPLSYYAVRSRYPTYPLRHRAGFASRANSNSSSNAVGGSKGTDEPCRPDWFLLQTLLLQQQQ